MAICKDCRMIPLDSFVDKMVDLTLLIDIFLRGVRIEDVVKIEAFICMPVIDFNLFTLRTSMNEGVPIIIFDLVFQKRSYSDCCLYFTTHNKIIQCF